MIVRVFKGGNKNGKEKEISLKILRAFLFFYTLFWVFALSKFFVNTPNSKELPPQTPKVAEKR